MRKILTIIIMLLAGVSAGAHDYDVCVYGGTASGVIAAYSAARMGADVLLIGPDVTLGGMTTGGLGLTDIGNKQAVSGIARQFYRKLGEHYGNLEQWVFEPHVAEDILEGYLRLAGVRVIREAPIESVKMSGGRIVSINCAGRTYKAGQFVDCSYEGDLMALAGVTYRVGREDNAEYGEKYDGSQLMDGHQFPDGIDPFREPGNPDSGLLWGISDWKVKPDGTGDDYVQAYNYRICLTDNPDNLIPIEKPEGYDPSMYDLLPRLFERFPEKLSLNDWFIWSHMPGDKTDINNRGAFSSDMIGMNHSYPEASWTERNRIIKAHRDYTLGLLYFYGHDERVPEKLRSEMLRWGLPKDEYVRTGHWTHQLYVRECRRLVGEYVATQTDCDGLADVKDGVAMAAYQMDSHNCERIVVFKDGKYMVKNEGNVEIAGGLPYPISYRSLTPKREECTNLLVPVCLSASHIAYGSIRMEPVFMATGQAAGMAATMAGNGNVQDVDVSEIQRILRENPCLDGSEPDILVEDNSPAVKYSGWKPVNGSAGYGRTYLQLDKGVKDASLTYTLPDGLEGTYTVYTYQLKSDNLARYINYDIKIGERTFRHEFDRNNLVVLGQTKGEWECLGEYEFTAGSGNTIDVEVVPDGKPARADEILLVRKTDGSGNDEEAAIQAMLASMTIADKLGQLNQLEGRIDPATLEAEIRAGRVSSIMNIVDPDDVDRLQRIAVEESPAGIPILFSRDVIHGFKTILPIPLGQAAGWNAEVITAGAAMAAEEATEAGIRWGFGPMVDVSRDSRWGRIAESFGEDPLLNAVFGLAQVKGYQGTDLSDPTSIAACAKHFVGYGAARGGRDYNGTDLTERELRDTYLVPFRTLMQGGCASVMTSFQDNDGLQASANSWLLRDIVRGEWGWDGVIVSDYGSIGQLTKHGIAGSRKDAARIGLNCGSDMDMQSKVFVSFVEQLIEEGQVSMEDVDKAVANVLRMKLRLGLFEHPYTQKTTHATGSQSHLDIALDAARESAVLLKNDGILPLCGDKKTTILVTGPMADAAYDQLGTWDMDGDTTLTVTPKMAFQARGDSNINVIYVPGLEYSRDCNTDWKAVKKAARKADVILVCLGEEQILSGEAHSLADIGLKGAQTEYVEFLAGLGKPLVATVMSGRANTIEKEVSLCNAVICQFHPGTMGGEALAEIVFGDVNPSGKLPITFPKMVGQCPIYYNEFRTGRSDENKKAVGSLDQIPRGAKQSVLGHDCRYLDAGTKPLFPFGYGLSYTAFEYSEPVVEAQTLSLSDTLRFSVKVSNVGGTKGKEVVQVYVTDRFASMSRPVRELKAFEKIELAAGEARTVEFAVPVQSLGYHNADCEYEVSLGEFEVMVSDCSDPALAHNARTFKFTVK